MASNMSLLSFVALDKVSVFTKTFRLQHTLTVCLICSYCAKKCGTVVVGMQLS